jgi:hypothetical protein
LETYKAAARALQPHGHVQERLAVAQRAKERRRLFQSPNLSGGGLSGDIRAVKEDPASNRG